ncbi:MAG: radical SAM protein, partial [Dehalococcoidia bacterium]|nr:radical SAM protein [Dehalococcoidia bacterium]
MSQEEKTGVSEGQGKPFCFEMGPIRPPSEGQDRSLLIRLVRNCPWNRCDFCSAYKGAKFEYRDVAEVKRDIDAVKSIADALRAASWKQGLGGRVTDGAVRAMVQERFDLYQATADSAADVNQRLQNLVSVANWMNVGAKTVFLQDADAMIMRVPELVEVLRHLKQTFPSIERITSYARSKTIYKRSLEEMKALHEAGLSRLHVGLESGCDEVLEFMQKGVTGRQQIEAGRKIVAAGITLSEYVMPGLGGKKWSQKHAVDTAHVLNEIGKVDFIRLRSLIVRKNTPLFERLIEGDFVQLTEDEMVEEERLFVSSLTCEANLVSDQMSNLLWEVEGRLPQDKTAILSAIDSYQSMPEFDKLEFRLQRRAGSYTAV